MGFRTNRSGKTYNQNKPSSNSNSDVISNEKKETTKSLREDLRKERMRLTQLKRQEVAKEKAKAKNRAIRESISRIRREQSLLTSLTTNRISPDKVNEIRHGTKEHMGSQFRTIPGLVG